MKSTVLIIVPAMICFFMIACTDSRIGETPAPPDQPENTDSYNPYNPSINDLPKIIADFNSGDSDNFRQAMDALNFLADNPDNVVKIIDYANGDNPEMSGPSRNALNILGLIPASLADSIWGENCGPKFQRDFESAIPEMAVPDIVARLIDHLDDSDPEVRSTALELLGYFGQDALPAVETVVRILREDQSDEVRTGAIALLGSIDIHNQDAVISVLLDALDDPYWEVRAYAIDILAWVSEENENIVPSIRELLNDENEIVRENASRALEVIESGSTMLKMDPGTDVQDSSVVESEEESRDNP